MKETLEFKREFIQADNITIESSTIIGCPMVLLRKFGGVTTRIHYRDVPRVCAALREAAKHAKEMDL